MDETTHVTDIQVRENFLFRCVPSTRPPFTIVQGGNVRGPAWIRENKFLPVEAERGILRCPHTESLEGSPSKTSDFLSSVKPFSGGEKKSAEVKEQAVCGKQEGEQWETDQSEECLRPFHFLLFFDIHTGSQKRKTPQG